jgi:hypothetical protein
VKPGGWRSRSSGPAVPLSRIQTDILRLLAAHRDPESYVAGAAPLNRDAPRISSDIADISIIFAKRNHNCRNCWFGGHVLCRRCLSGR